MASSLINNLARSAALKEITLNISFVMNGTQRTACLAKGYNDDPNEHEQWLWAKKIETHSLHVWKQITGSADIYVCVTWRTNRTRTE